ncbi:MAG TPA: FAD-dependent oxidoreductase [Candidatus Dormibacteraeota bacterium]
MPERADVLVIGGGITGVSLLYWLRGRARAVLVERHHLAAGASGRNAGFLLAGVAACYAEAVRRYGRHRARETWAFTAETHDLLAVALQGREVGYRRTGSQLLPASQEEAAELAASAELLREDGFEASWDGERLLNPRDGELDPVRAVSALAELAPTGSIREGVKVEALEASPGGVRVFAGPDECLAGAVVLATNAYTPLLLPEVGIAPVRAQMLATGPERRRLVDMPTYSERGFRYWRQLPDGRLLAGGFRHHALEEEVGYEAVTTARVQGLLEGEVRRLGAQAPIATRWSGIMGFTETELPVVGPVAGRPGIWVCGGYSGHGMGFAFQCARLLADRLTGPSRETQMGSSSSTTGSPQ